MWYVIRLMMQVIKVHSTEGEWKNWFESEQQRNAVLKSSIVAAEFLYSMEIQ